MKKILPVVGTVLLVVIALAGPTTVVGEEAAVSEETVALYNKKCAMCHGKDGVAKKMAEGSANLNDPEWQGATSPDEVAEVITGGKGKMKGLEGKISPEEIKAVATYVLQLK